MDVYIRFLDGRDEIIENVEVVKENSRMRSIDVTCKERERLIAEGENCAYTDKTFRKRKILNFAAVVSIVIVEIESIVIVEEE